MNDDSGQGAERHPILRGVVLFVVTPALCWLAYVWLASTIAANRLRALAASSGMSVQHVDARTWFPGHLVLRDLVVSHSWRGRSCRTSAALVNLPHGPLQLLQGNLRVETLTADKVAIACGSFRTPLAAVATTKAALGVTGMQALSFADDDSPTRDAIEVRRAVIRIHRVSLGQIAMTTPFELRASNVDVTGGRLGFDSAELSLEAGALSWKTQRTPAAVEGSLQLDLDWQDGQLAPGSSSNLTLAPFSWSHEGKAQTQFEGTSSLEAKLMPPVDQRAAQIDWQINVPALRHQGEHALRAEARDIRLRISSDARHGLPLGYPVDFQLQASAIAVDRAQLGLKCDRASFEGRLAGVPREGSLFDTARISLRDATLRADVSAGPQPNESPGPDSERHFSSTIRLNSLASTDGYSGDLHATGADAGVILTLVQPRDLPEWIESKFQGEPFELDAAIVVKEGTVRLSDLVLDRGALHLRGFWLVDPEQRGGALLLEYGGMSVGIDGSQGGGVVLRPGPDWLQEKSPPLPARPSGGG